MNHKPVNLINVSIYLGNQKVSVGRLALQRERIYFEYDQRFLELGLEISPFYLPLKTGVISNQSQIFDGLFGVFNDSMPDGWGKLLLDRAVQAQGIPYQSLTPLDRLAFVGENAMGALRYEPDNSEKNHSSAELDLLEIEQEVNKVLEGDPSVILKELLELGGSSAGARPKILVGYNADHGNIIHGVGDMPDLFEPWIIKFPSSLDQKDIANIEYAYAQMAREAGLNMPSTKLFVEEGGKSYFGIKRFDRQGNQKIHMHTAAGLLHADHRIPSLDYENLMRGTLALTKDMSELVQVFRLACFNVFAHNRDDHSKNFSFLMDTKGKWSFAPAYDLTFSYGPGGEHSSMIMGEGRNPGTKELLKLSVKFQIKNAIEMIEEVKEAVGNWRTFAADAGVSKSSQHIIQQEINKRLLL